jgi:hypothetical protein
MLHQEPAHNDDPMEEDFTFDEISIKTRKETPYGKEEDNQGQGRQERRD